MLILFSDARYNRVYILTNYAVIMLTKSLKESTVIGRSKMVPCNINFKFRKLDTKYQIGTVTGKPALHKSGKI